MTFVQEKDGLYRLWVPFEKIAASVFLLLTQSGPVLYDCAMTAADVENIILPALRHMHIAPEQLQALVLSHAHADHSGGLGTLLQHAPQIRVLARAPQKYAAAVYATQDGEMLLDDVMALHLPGHTADCLGLYDLRTGTLLTADALQLQGIDRFGCAVKYPEDYKQTIEKIRRLAPRRILTSHVYVPFGEKAEGLPEITRYLDGCLDVLREIEAFADSQPPDVQAITEAFRAKHPHWPLLPQSTIEGLLRVRKKEK